MENWFFVLHGLYNSAIEERRTSYKTEGRSITYTEQQNSLPKLKELDPAIKLIHSQVLQDCLQRVDKAYQKFFDDLKRKKSGKNVKIGYPRMKKLSRYSSFTFPQVWMKSNGDLKEVVKLRCDADSRFATIILPVIGSLKIRLHRSVDWKNAKTITVKRTASGDWYVCISVEKPLEPKLSGNGKSTGVDVGLTNLITTSDETYIEHQRFIRESEHRIKKAQRNLSRKKKGSANREKQRLRLAREHERIANQRKDFLHKLSLWLVLNYAYIAFENLNIPGMVRNPHLAKTILDAGWGSLTQFTAYKSVMLRGNDVVRVNPTYSSQDCSVCRYRVPKTLAERMHVCPNCGAVMDRDHNAANVIEFRAFGNNTVGAGSAPNQPLLQEVNACGDETSALSSAQGKSCL
jgi:putative transposase